MDDHRASCVATSSAVATHGWRQRRVRSPVHEYAETSKLSTISLRNAATSTCSEPAWLPNGNLRGAAPGVSTTAAARSALVRSLPHRQHVGDQQALQCSRRLQRRLAFCCDHELRHASRNSRFSCLPDDRSVHRTDSLTDERLPNN